MSNGLVGEKCIILAWGHVKTTQKHKIELRLDCIVCGSAAGVSNEGKRSYDVGTQVVLELPHRYFRGRKQRFFRRGPPSRRASSHMVWILKLALLEIGELVAKWKTVAERQEDARGVRTFEENSNPNVVMSLQTVAVNLNDGKAAEGQNVYSLGRPL
jgi:hypothetical protein